jgi:hypothetical protein
VPGIGEAAAIRAEVYRLDRADHDKMRHDLFCFDKPAVESGGGAPQYRTARDELRPLALSETLTETVTRAASKNIRKRLMHGGESVDTNTPFSIIRTAEGEVFFMQNSIMGGSSVMDAMVVAVIPARPAGPSVVTI